MDKRLYLVKIWFMKADNDLKNAKIVIEAEKPPTDTVCFHCQQTAEKYLKGFLAYHNREFEKAHNLGYLLDLCCEIDSSFNSIRDIAEDIAPYAIEPRYPDEFFYEYPIDEAREAIRIAEHIIEFVKGKIALDVIG